MASGGGSYEHRNPAPWNNPRQYIAKKIPAVAAQAAAQYKQVSALFAGLDFFIGTGEVGLDALREAVVSHGGHFRQPIEGDSGASHVLCSTLRAGNAQRAMARQSGRNAVRQPAVVKPQFVFDCVRDQRLLPEIDYAVVPLQPGQARLGFSSSGGGGGGVGGSSSSSAGSAASAAPRAAPRAQQQPLRSPGRKVTTSKTSREVGFVDNFLGNSRLHHIGAWQRPFSEALSRYRQEKGQRPANKAVARQPRLVMLVDMDCFFASVALLSRGHLRSKPFAVCHGTDSADAGSKSKVTGEISSANYVARAKGVKAGMWAEQALKLCPELECATYEFEAYTEISEKVYRVLWNAVGGDVSRMQAASCEEAYVDITDVAAPEWAAAGPPPEYYSLEPAEQMAVAVRAEVLRRTGCICSVGIGPSKFAAKIATNSAKPDGYCMMNQEQVAEAILQMDVRDLPGVGYSTQKQLAEMAPAVLNCRQLVGTPLMTLQRELGDEKGQALHDSARGVKAEEFEGGELPSKKSHSVEISWGVRFLAGEEGLVQRFLNQLVGHVHDKMCQSVDERGACKKVTVLTYKSRDVTKGGQKGYLGHGPCDKTSKSVSLVVATQDVAVLKREAWQLFGAAAVPPDRLRGLQISLSDLTRADDAAKQLTSYFGAAPAGGAAVDRDRGRSVTHREPQPMQRIPPVSRKRPAALRAVAPVRVPARRLSPPRDTSQWVAESFSQTDPDFLLALPEAMRREMEAEQQRQQQVRGRGAASSSASSRAASAHPASPPRRAAQSSRKNQVQVTLTQQVAHGEAEDQYGVRGEEGAAFKRRAAGRPRVPRGAPAQTSPAGRRQQQQEQEQEAEERYLMKTVPLRELRAELRSIMGAEAGDSLAALVSNTTDTLAAMSWQLLEQRQLDEVEAMLLFLRREALASHAAWRGGFDWLLGKVQEMVKARHRGSRLRIESIVCL